MLKRRPLGLSLVEVMVSIAVMLIVMQAAVPAFGAWTADLRVRAAAESLKAGMDLARTEAIRRNAAVSFRLQPDAKTLWAVGCDGSACPAMLQSAPRKETGALGIEALSNDAKAASLLGYDGLGRISDTDGIRSVTVSSPGASRPLVLRVRSGGAVRVCPAVQVGSAACT